MQVAKTNTKRKKNLNIAELSKDIEFLSTNKTHSNIQKKIVPNLHKLFQETEEEGELANSSYEATIVLLLKCDMDVLLLISDIDNTRNFRPISLMNTDVKILIQLQQMKSSNIKKDKIS